MSCKHNEPENSWSKKLNSSNGNFLLTNQQSATCCPLGGLERVRHESKQCGMFADRGSWLCWHALLLIFSNRKNQGMMGNTCCQLILKLFNSLRKLMGENLRINLWFQTQQCITMQLYVTDHWYGSVYHHWNQALMVMLPYLAGCHSNGRH